MIVWDALIRRRVAFYVRTLFRSRRTQINTKGTGARELAQLFPFAYH